MPRMSLGLNLPWSRYGADFGVRHNRADYWPSDGEPAWRATLPGFLQALGPRDVGFSAIRLWMLGDGGNYGRNFQLDPSGHWQNSMSPEFTPHRNRDGSWKVDSAAPLSEHFMDDFIFMLQAISAAGLRAIPVLIDHGFCFDGDPVSSPPLVKGGRYELINDEAKRAQFLTLVLSPLVQRVHGAGLDSAIYAWDLINEPEWCTAVLYPHVLRSLWESFTGQGWQGVRHANVSQQNMKAYIREGASVINRAGFRSTVGFVDMESPQSSGLHAWDDAALGVSLHQFHYRALLDNLVPHNSHWTSTSPCFIGEIDEARRPAAMLPTGVSASAGLYDRLRMIENRGYAATFIWLNHPEHPVDSFLFFFGSQDEIDVRRYLTETR